MKLLLEREELIDREELQRMYCRVFDSKEGQIVLQDLANVSGVYRSNFARDASDYTSFLEGHRSLFFYICSQLEKYRSNIEGGNMAGDDDYN